MRLQVPPIEAFKQAQFRLLTTGRAEPESDRLLTTPILPCASNRAIIGVIIPHYLTTPLTIL